MVGSGVGVAVASGAGVSVTTTCSSGSSPPKLQPVAAAETIADIVKIAKIFLFFIVSSLFLFISKFCKSTLFYFINKTKIFLVYKNLPSCILQFYYNPVNGFPTTESKFAVKIL